MIDPVSGYWAKNEDDGGGAEPEDPTASPRQWIVPSVQDRKNALLFQPTGQVYSQMSLATVQHALLRGLEAVFQLEEGEILAEPMPIRDERSGVLLYEATEGGAGVLTRLVAEPALLSEVAKKALEIMHFALGENGSESVESLHDIADTSCVAACYRCLMSYFNQPDHELLDRRDVDARTLLLRLARSRTSGLVTQTTVSSATIGSNDTTLQGAPGRWMERLQVLGLPMPDLAPLTAGNVQFPLVWRNHYAVAALGGADENTLAHLQGLGFEIVIFESSESTWAKPFSRLAAALGTKQ